MEYNNELNRNKEYYFIADNASKTFSSNGERN